MATRAAVAAIAVVCAAVLLATAVPGVAYETAEVRGGGVLAGTGEPRTITRTVTIAPGATAVVDCELR